MVLKRHNDVIFENSLDLDAVPDHLAAFHKKCATTADFSIRLITATGGLSAAVPLSKYLTLDGPIGGCHYEWINQQSVSVCYRRPILQMVRIPLTDFAGVSLDKVIGVRIEFNKSPAGEIYVANIRFAK